MLKLNGRKITDETVSVPNPKSFVDTYFSYAVYEDTGDELTDDELDLLTNIYEDYLCNYFYEDFWGSYEGPEVL